MPRLSPPPGYDPTWWDEPTIQGIFTLNESAPQDEGWYNEVPGEGDALRGVWAAVLREMEGQMTRATFQNLFAQTMLVKVQDDVAIIAVPSAQVQAWLENRLQEQLAGLLGHHLGHPVRLYFVQMGR